VTHRLLHPNFEVEREYVASVVPDTEYSSRIIPLESLKEQVETMGIPILLRDRSDSTVKTSFTCFGQVLDINQGDDDFIHVRLIVKEGKHRMVRRMFAYCGYTVVELHRERHGAFELKDLKSGQFRPATETEIAWVQSLE
jgi:pseudouridine synthase